MNGKRAKNAVILGIIVGCTVTLSKITNSAYLPWPTIMQNNQRTGVYPGFGEIGNMFTANLKWVKNISSYSNLAALGDLDGDNVAEVVVAATNGYVYALNGVNGDTKWSKNIGVTAYASAPAIGNIDADGVIEIVILGMNGVLYALDGTNGNIKWSENVTSTELWSSPAIGDIDGNPATIEIVIACKDKTVALRGSNGSVLWTQPLAAGDVVPAIGNIDGDAAIEVISASNSELYALSGANGSVKCTTPITTTGGAEYVFIPAIADIDDDGIVEVVVQPSQYIYAINGTNGNIKWSRSFGALLTGTTTYCGVALGDIDGDNGLEVIVRDGFSRIYALDENTGSTLWSYQFSGGSGMVKSPPTLVDVEDDGLLEVIGGNHSGYIPCLEGEGGAFKWEMQISPGDLHCNHSVGDIDGDGCFEIVGISCPGLGASYAKVYAMEAPCPGPGIEENKNEPRNIDFKVLNRKNSIEISFTLSNPLANTDVSISVFDVCGREKSRLNLGTLGAGNHQWTLNISEFENSVYFVRLSIGETCGTRKVVVIR